MKTQPGRYSYRIYIIGVLLATVVMGIIAASASNPVLAPGKQSANAPALPGNSRLLDSLLHSDPRLANVLAHPGRYELQVIYTQIDRDARNVPRFTSHTYHVNPRQYFNPASLVKLPVAALSLEKLNDLQKPGVNRSTIMATSKAFRCQTAVPFAAPADSDRTASVGNYIKRMLLVSDNVAYNRLYEFLGQRPLNDRLAQLGYPNARITRRFAPCDTTANRYTNPISFHSRQGDTLYKEAQKVNRHSYNSPLGPVLKGKGYQAGGRIINEPYNFTSANHLSLPDITTVLQKLLFPLSFPEAQRFRLSNNDYSFLRRYLHATPHQSGFHLYTAAAYFDAYKKYLFYGRRKDAVRQPGLHIFNVVGMSHGYLADVAYFADSVKQTEFLLSAVIYVNRDGIINDGAYEYESVGMPFLQHLGQLVHKYELRRSRQRTPDLTEFFAP